MAAEAFGLESVTAGEIPVDVFVFILFVVVTIGILGGNIFNVFFLKSYDKKVESLKSGNAALVPVITTAMFLGMYGTMAAPPSDKLFQPSGGRCDPGGRSHGHRCQ